MKELKTFSEFMGQQKQLRKKLLKVRAMNPLSWEDLAREIGISHITLRKFAIDEIDVQFRILSKIRNFIMKYESKPEMN